MSTYFRWPLFCTVVCQAVHVHVFTYSFIPQQYYSPTLCNIHFPAWCDLTFMSECRIQSVFLVKQQYKFCIFLSDMFHVEWPFSRSWLIYLRQCFCSKYSMLAPDITATPWGYTQNTQDVGPKIISSLFWGENATFIPTLLQWRITTLRHTQGPSLFMSILNL